MKTYVQYFDTKKAAYTHMLDKNRGRTPEEREHNGNFTLFCVVDGPANNFVVVDLNSAEELGCSYEWNQ